MASCLCKRGLCAHILAGACHAKHAMPDLGEAACHDTHAIAYHSVKLAEQRPRANTFSCKQVYGEIALQIKQRAHALEPIAAAPGCSLLLCRVYTLLLLCGLEEMLWRWWLGFILDLCRVLSRLLPSAHSQNFMAVAESCSYK